MLCSAEEAPFVVPHMRQSATKSAAAITVANGSNQPTQPETGDVATLLNLSGVPEMCYMHQEQYGSLIDGRYARSAIFLRDVR